MHPNTSHQALTELACRVNKCISQLNRRVIGRYSNPKVLTCVNALKVPLDVRR